MVTFDDLYAEAERHDDYWTQGSVIDFTEEISRVMKQQGVSRAVLAKRLGTSSAYVTKILRGRANFTLASMTKMARALNCELRLHLAPAGVHGRFVDWLARKPLNPPAAPPGLFLKSLGGASYQLHGQATNDEDATAA
jgi:transcriptional regulator with XRE-family HTH domain